MASLDLAEELKKGITGYPSRFASDSEFIVDFINEVSRSSETRSAARGCGDFPTGNWIHVFHDFKGVIDVLRTQVFAGIPAEDAATRKLLSMEITETLRVCLLRCKDSAYLPEGTVEYLANRYELDTDTIMPCTVLDPKDRATILRLALHVRELSLHTITLQHVLNSTAFLEFEKTTGLVRETPVYRGLYLLAEEIRVFMFSKTQEVMWQVLEDIVKYSPAAQSLSVPTVGLALLLHCLDRWIDIAKLCAAILKHLAGEPFTMPQVRPRSPLCGEDEELEKEEVSLEQLQDFLASQP